MNAKPEEASGVKAAAENCRIYYVIEEAVGKNKTPEAVGGGDTEEIAEAAVAKQNTEMVYEGFFN